MKLFKLFLCQCGVGRTDSIDRSNSSLLAVPSDIYRYSRSLEELILKNNQVKSKDRLKLFFSFLTNISSYCTVIIIFKCTFDVYIFYIEEILVYWNSFQIKELPKPFFNLKRLKRLILKDNDLCYIPNDIGNLTHLNELDVNNNGKY